MDARTAFEHDLAEGISLAAPSAVRVLDALLKYAITMRASDIHICPSSLDISVRMRIDGTLHSYAHVPRRMHDELLARIKILSGMRTDEHHHPQDGKFSFNASTDTRSPKLTDIRVSVVPTQHGENAILRILASSESLTSLHSLGFSESHSRIVMNAIRKPNGLVLITGSTGSGKTSTLYSLIQNLQTGTSSIITIEDPIEYSIPEVTQLYADGERFTFSEGLRSILRQDPDVIGVGEIRDEETAKMALHAALTGHMVLSTLHSINAPSAISRLLAMNIDPYLIASTLTLVIHQTLVPRLCSACSKRITVRKELKEALERMIPHEQLRPISHMEAAGCHMCSHQGRKGRIGVFELLPMTQIFRTKVLNGHLSEYAFSTETYSPLWNDAFHKATSGHISMMDAVSLYENYAYAQK